MQLCRLCQTSTDLQESHIIPAFVYRWQKKDFRHWLFAFWAKSKCESSRRSEMPFSVR